MNLGVTLICFREMLEVDMPNKLAKLVVLSLVVGLAPALKAADEIPFDWVDQRAGDCHLSGTLRLHSDGHASFDATSWTDHSNSGDV